MDSLMLEEEIPRARECGSQNCKEGSLPLEGGMEMDAAPKSKCYEILFFAEMRHSEEPGS